MKLEGPFVDSAGRARVMLLNPPSEQPVLRDNYCGFVSKASYIWPPIDLLVQSGWLHGEHALSVVDAVAEDLRPDAVLGRLRAWRPDAVFMLSSSATFEDDARFALAMRRALPHARLVAGLAAMVISPGQYFHRYPWMDGALHDFSSPALAQALRGEPHDPELVTPDDLVEHRGHAPKASKPTRLSYPTPQHDLFPLAHYSIPLGWRGPFSTVLTSFGCAHQCTFCSGGATRYRVRPREEVLEELLQLRDRGVKNLFFVDYTFTTHRENLLWLCGEMQRRDLGLRFTCFGRVDHLDQEVVRALAGAGCDLLQIGVESGDDRILERYRKGFTVDQVRRAFALCRRERLKTLAFFIIGLPGETHPMVERTVQFALELDPDLASFAMPTPDPGTSLREEARKRGVMGNDPVQVLSTVGPTVGSDALNPAEIKRLRARAVRRFYLRPRFLVRQVSQLKSPADLWDRVQNALELLRRSQ